MYMRTKDIDNECKRSVISDSELVYYFFIFVKNLHYYVASIYKLKNTLIFHVQDGADLDHFYSICEVFVVTNGHNI